MLHKISVILCIAAVICGVYLLAIFLISLHYRRSLHRGGQKPPRNGELSVYAEAETLEYAVRCALLASGGGQIAVVVNIRRDDKARDEMIDMTEKLARTHNNLSYRII